MSASSDSRRRSTVPLFALIFLVLFALHLPLLRLPYFWDEAGYYVPAARDLLLTGSLIPHSTPSNAHPPLVMAYLALAWKLTKYSPIVTRAAMLLVAAFCLLGVHRLARQIANSEVAVASVICTGLYPVYFAQSSLAHLDLAAAGFTVWGLLAYFEDRNIALAVWFSLAVLSKETAVLAPMALLAWEVLARVLRQRSNLLVSSPLVRSIALAAPLLPLALWYLYHYHRTGFLFGNPEFFRYNVQATVHPLRIVLALGMRLWQVTAYMNLYLLTLAALFAMWRDPLGDRPRIALDTQFALLAVILTYVVAMAVVGGAVLARYMLPVIPLIIIVCVSTLWRRALYWRVVIAIVILGFVVALFVNPPYGFSIEDNLAYRDYIILHENAERFVEARYPTAKVLTAWPASDELRRPYLGYISRPMTVVRIEDFTVEQLMSASQLRPRFDLALVFSTKYIPAHPWFEHWIQWQQWKAEFFGYHRDVPPAAAAQILGGDLVYADKRDGQWVGVIEMERLENAHTIELNYTPRPGNIYSTLR